MKNFRVVPLTLGDANALVGRLHRHHRPMKFHIVSIGAKRRDTDCLVGASILMRPCSTVLDDGVTIEVARLVTDGTHNAASFLLGASAKLACSLGYLRIQTYSLAEESGASLRGAGWRMERCFAPQSWNRMKRARLDDHVVGPRIRWAAYAPEVFSTSATSGLEVAYFLGEAAGKSGAAPSSNPFSPADEPEAWALWREGWSETSLA